jgi:hypothetical protein
MDFFLIFLVVVMVACLYFGFIRNTQVLNFRKGMLDTIYENNMAAFERMRNEPGLTVVGVQAEGDQLLAKYETLETVDYNEMVLKFWKPLKPEAWYADTSFLK